jgi:mannan endo-1,4-beta-mannosidase
MKKALHRLAVLSLPLALAAGVLPAQSVSAAVDKTARYNAKAPKGFKRKTAKGVINVNKYIYPRREYVGVFTQYENKNTTPVAGARYFGKLVGKKKPNVIKGFANWGAPFDRNWAKTIWKAGAIPQWELEVHPVDWNDQMTVKKIANGRADAYVRQLAKDVKAANVPVAISFAHEFNGDWYEWGFCSRPKNNPPATACRYKTTPAQFKKAWRRIHNIFTKAGATNAIWMWSPNEVGPRSEVKLKPFYPGDAYVDWIGLIGYYRSTSSTYAKVFTPSIKQLRKFTKKPILIGEVSTLPGKSRPRQVRDFLKNVAADPGVIGFIWFNKDQRKNEGPNGDYRVERDKASVKAFKTGLKKGYFGRK